MSMTIVPRRRPGAGRLVSRGITAVGSAAVVAVTVVIATGSVSTAPAAQSVPVEKKVSAAQVVKVGDSRPAGTENRARKGLVFDGLAHGTKDKCGTATFVVRGSGALDRCSHGPDPAPAVRDPAPAGPSTRRHPPPPRCRRSPPTRPARPRSS